MDGESVGTVRGDRTDGHTAATAARSPSRGGRPVVGPPHRPCGPWEPCRLAAGGDPNGFTYSLAIYPAVALGLLLERAGRAGPRFWAILLGAGLLFLGLVHFGPQAIEPPADIIEPHGSRVVGWLAFGWLLLLVAVLFMTLLYQVRLARARGSHGVAVEH